MGILYVFIGGGLGSVCRYLIGKWSSEWHTTLPYGTFIANLLACLILGAITGYVMRHGESRQLYLLFAVGFCGGFSTFSTFSLENVQLWQSGDYATLLLNVVISVIVCFGALLLGMKLGG